MNSLLCDKEFLLLWFKNFLAIEQRGSVINSDEVPTQPIDTSLTNTDQLQNGDNTPSKNIHSAGDIFHGRPSVKINLHDMAIVEDPRFENTTCDFSNSRAANTPNITLFSQSLASPPNGLSHR